MYSSLSNTRHNIVHIFQAQRKLLDDILFTEAFFYFFHKSAGNFLARGGILMYQDTVVNSRRSRLMLSGSVFFAKSEAAGPAAGGGVP
jgi:hypothetical protein